MSINISFSLNQVIKKIENLASIKNVAILSSVLAVTATAYSYAHNYILLYGDSESHLNIAKKVVSSLTPGFAQLGGIWLPLPHILMIPFVYFDPLWRSGLAGAIISGIAYIISCIYLYKLTHLLTKNRYASFFAFLVFGLNPNVLYIQSTPLTELPLIVFFILSTYYFAKYLKSRDYILHLILAAFFGFCATLSRYDGWFLVLLEAVILCSTFINKRELWKKLEGRIILFSTLAFFGIALWLLWSFLILGDPLYFSDSMYSAKSQQISWLQRGELPGYHNIAISFLYYFVTSMSLTGLLLFLTAMIGCIAFLRNHHLTKRYAVLLLLFAPFIFNWISLFAGQSVIFIPSLTPASFEWRLFNVRYGIMMAPFVSVMLGYLFAKSKNNGKLVIAGLLFVQLCLFTVGYSPIYALDDGQKGLSAAKNPDAQIWLAKHYDNGLVLIDDYARSVSVIKSGIPMQNIIYVGTKPYYQESFKTPSKYAKWIIIQKDDDIWNHLYATTGERAVLYTSFKKVYTSKDTLIFEKNQDTAEK